MRPRGCSIRAVKRGQTATEFALVTGVFLLALFAIIEMAQAVFAYNTICEAAQEAARYAMVHSPTSANPATTSQIQQVAIDSAVSLNLTQNDVSVSWPADGNLPSKNDAQVSVSYNYMLRMPFMSPITLTLSGSAQTLVSQ